MDAREFIELLKNPEKVGQKSVEELKKLSLEYPYSQPVQLLYAMRLSQSSEYLFNRQLGKTAILTDDRSVLFDLFERDDEEQEVRVEEPESPSDDELLEAHLTDNVKQAETEISQEDASKEPGEPSRQEVIPEEADDTADESALVEEKEHEDFEETVGIYDEAEEKPEPSLKEEKEQTAPEPEQPKAETKASEKKELSASERVKAILEENRRLREQHQKTREQSGSSTKSPVDERISGIRDRLEKIKRQKEEESRQEAEDATSVTSETEAVESAEPEVSQPDQTEDTERVASQPEEDIAKQEPEPFEISPQEPVSEEREEEKPSELKESSAEEEENSAEEEALLEQHQKEEEDDLVDSVDEEERWQAPQNTVFTIEDEDEEPQEELEEVQPEEEAPAEAEPEEDTSDEEYSFSGWLKRLQGPVETKSSTTEQTPREESQEDEEKSAEEPEDIDTKLQLLDSFVEKLPELKKKQKNPPKSASRPDIEMRGLSEEESSLVTETLAKVYVKQKHYEKAMKAYEILRLKYPEKSGFFADRISEIKKLINSK